MEQKFPMEQGWLLCRETGGRAELTMEVPGGAGDSTGGMSWGSGA
ncbi:MAG: hypothetical protein ACLR1T_16980 [Evtepia gabavorous]